MYCIKCGKELADGTKFCPYCGQSTQEKTIKTEATKKDTVERKEKKPFSTKKALVGVGILAVVVIGIMLFFVPQLLNGEGILEKFDMKKDTVGDFISLLEEEEIDYDEEKDDEYFMINTLTPDSFLGFDSYYHIDRNGCYDSEKAYRTAAGKIKMKGDCVFNWSVESALGISAISDNDLNIFEYQPKSKESESIDYDTLKPYLMSQTTCFEKYKDYKKGREKIYKHFEDESVYHYKKDNVRYYIYDIDKVEAIMPYRVFETDPMSEKEEAIEGEVIVREKTIPVYMMVSISEGNFDDYYDEEEEIKYREKYEEWGLYCDDYNNHYLNIVYGVCAGEEPFNYDNRSKAEREIVKELTEDLPKDKVKVYKTIDEYEDETGTEVKGKSQEEIVKEQKLESVYELYQQYVNDVHGDYFDDYYYEFAYVDNDDIPELFVSDNNTYVYMFYLENDEVCEISGKLISYHKGDGKIYIWQHPGGGLDGSFVYKYENRHMETLFEGVNQYDGDIDTYTVNGKEVSEEEYTRMFNAVWNYDNEQDDIIHIEYEVPYDSLEEAYEALMNQ